MSPFLDLIKPLNVVIAYAIPTALLGIPILWQHLTRKPGSRRQIKNAAWTIFIAGCWIFFGNFFFFAYQEGFISLPEFIGVEVVLFAMVGGSFLLVERRYPEQAT